MNDRLRVVARGRALLVGVFAGAALCLVAAAAFPPAATALPLYASREGATCVTCHFDPNGGGMRNEFGFYYGKNRHSMGEEDRWADVKVTPQVNDWIRLGLDTRFMYYASHLEGGSSTLYESTFFPMEGQLRIAITPYENLAILGTQGIVIQDPGYPNSYIARELYVLFKGLPAHGYIQAGRFRSPFGLKQEDHTSLVRTDLVLPYDSQKEDAGIEVGAVGKHWFGQMAFMNGDVPFGGHADLFAAKVGYASRYVQLGYSFLDRTSGAGQYRSGVYASTTIGRATFLGEYVAGTEANPRGAFTELVYRASRGVNVRAKFDYYDEQPFFALVVGRRYLGEVDINPMPFVNLKLSYRHWHSSSPPDINEYFGMLFVPF